MGFGSREGVRGRERLRESVGEGLAGWFRDGIGDGAWLLGFSIS